ncbi:MAG: aminopeptidase family protein P, partial [Pseudomonadota bacterium]
PVDMAWQDQPAAPMAPIHPHPLSFSGEASADKRVRLSEELRAQKADAALLTAPHSLAWLFNIRGKDVHASPLPLGRAILFADGRADLFIAPQKVTEGLAEHLGQDVQIKDEASIEDALETLGQAKQSVLIDPSLTPLLYTKKLADAGAALVKAPDPCALPRAIKNPSEQEGARAAHRRDGVAIARFLHWLDENATTGTVTEIGAASQLETFRRETNQLEDISFDTISGAGAHGAIVHYRVTTSTDQPLTQNSLYLSDSGGQYKDGTTDITRTVAVGTPTDEMRKHYTLVLKGHIALATAKFPAGTSGHQLDALARTPLWQAGLDYGHGTGHGVGSYLGVHEGPQKISKHPITQALLPGMICSNEPGYYVEGAYGIRIENLIIVTEPSLVENGTTPMMGFETITLAPLDRRLIDKTIMTDNEVSWVDTYHTKVKDTLVAQIPANVVDWLEAATAPL